MPRANRYFCLVTSGTSRV